MLRFEYFHEQWIDAENLIEHKPDLALQLEANFFDSLKFDISSIKEYRINAVKRLLPMLGSKPALCFSGGIDSQATWQCFNEAGIDIDVYVLVFKDGLNAQDTDHAIKFAERNKIKLNFIEIDILNFLSRENADYSKKYKSLSPHFNTHYKLCDILKSKNYTGFVCGGGTPLLTHKVSEWISNYNQNFLNYINYSEVSGILCQGNFLGYDPKLAWAVSILTPIFTYEKYGGFINHSERLLAENQRYKEKIIGYRNAGFDIIPQTTKFTGFELVKDKLETMYGDGWAFEKFYRFPLKKYVEHIDVKVSLNESIIEKIKDLNLKHTGSSIDAPTGI